MRAVIVRISVTPERIVIALNKRVLRCALLPAATHSASAASRDDEDELLQLTIEARLQRRGREVRLLVSPRAGAALATQEDRALMGSTGTLAAPTRRKRLWRDGCKPNFRKPLARDPFCYAGNVRKIPFQTRVPRIASSSTVGWVAAGASKPVLALSLDDVMLDPFKVAGICVISLESRVLIVTECGRTHAPARHRCPRRQDRSPRSGGSAQCDLRAEFPGLLVRISAWARTT